MASAVQRQPTLASLEGIPDDILYKIFSHLPTLTESHILFTCFEYTPMIPSTSLVRTPVLRALSQTSRLLRFRLLSMAWRRLELCTAPVSKYSDEHEDIWSFYSAVFKAVTKVTEAATHVLNDCPHLHPFIQTVTVILTNIYFDEVVPAFAACLAQLPNLTSIQVIHLHLVYFHVDIEKGFQGQQFPSVRKVSLPSTAHSILLSLPNVEEVVCINGTGNEIIDSLIKGNCRRVRILKGVSAPLAPLVPLLPDLRYIEVPHKEERQWDMKSLTDFPLLDTIEITSQGRDLPLLENQIREVSDVLKTNASHAGDKAVILTHWTQFRSENVTVTRRVIKV